MDIYHVMVMIIAEGRRDKEKDNVELTISSKYKQKKQNILFYYFIVRV